MSLTEVFFIVSMVLSIFFAISFWRRPDLRNHRKMLIIDGERGFLGSLNMIDSSYLMPKNIREGRHWVDVMVELSGPVIASMNTIFAVDWFMESDKR